MKANGTIFELNFILSQIFISEWTLSLSLQVFSVDDDDVVVFDDGFVDLLDVTDQILSSYGQ